MSTEADDVTIDPVPGETIGLLGPNGHGRDDGGDAAIAHALEMTGTTEPADRLWRAMSGGERRRARIARAASYA